MNKSIKITFVLLSLFWLSSCFKDSLEFEEYPNNPWANGQKVALDVSGEIIDENGMPVKDVLITANNKTALTDQNGVFVIKQSLQNPDFIHVKADKKGYFHGARVIRGTKSRVNSIKIILLKANTIAKINTADGGSLKVGAMNVTLPANGFVDAAGKSYSGNVNVAARYLDPNNPNTVLEMPGDFRAVNFQGLEQMLESYGMVHVELRDDNGNLLNLGNGKEATLSFPKPQNAKVHGKMPLWYFDEKIGAWREEGEAILDSKGNYIGNVKHFSCWNCDFPYDKVYAQGRVVDQNGKPLAGVWVGLDLVGSWQGGHGFTDGNGVFMGCIPKDKELELKIKDWGCSFATLYSKNVGSFSTDVNFGDITVNVPTFGPDSVKTIVGVAKDCAGNNLQNGYVFMILKGPSSIQRVSVFTDSEGKFKYSYVESKCQPKMTSASVVVYDLQAQKESNPKNFTINYGNNDFGVLESCISIDEFVDFKLGDSTFYAILPLTEKFLRQDSLTSKDLMYLTFTSQTNKNKYLQLGFEISSNPPIPGTYPIIDVFGWGMYETNLTPISINATITLSKVSLIDGEYNEGSIAGNITFSASDTRPLSGTFRVRNK
jgi:hypothetical protein